METTQETKEAYIKKINLQRFRYFPDEYVIEVYSVKVLFSGKGVAVTILWKVFAQDY